MHHDAAGAGSKPKNWPSDVVYLKHPVFSNSQLRDRLRPGSSACDYTGKALHELPTVSTPLLQQKAATKITSLANQPSHPAHPHFGLFATKDLKPGTLLLPYLGVVTLSDDADENSDYCLKLGPNLAVDGEKKGNEGRFVNDYRGIQSKPNVEFREYIDKSTNEIRMGIWVMNTAHNKKGIKKGSELCISYGKGFWKSRSVYV
ncbi:hypothetical protein H4219_001199 [Mycoemilia scoparia]|uniref:SET domain-containing protein n=1 Tax=Mycoemilia scoparia TaxID=417184 RepID=A0A9W8A0W1_9FUNG|nr:hypothetical protein H4219_001199 [Mycoemilia scoparia]